MKMLWEPLSHLTGVVALRHMFASAISANRSPQGNLDGTRTYTGPKLVLKWEQITVAAVFDPDALCFAAFPTRVFDQPVSWAAGGGRRCVLLLLLLLLYCIPDYLHYRGRRWGPPQSHPFSEANKQIESEVGSECVCLEMNNELTRAAVRN